MKKIVKKYLSQDALARLKRLLAIGRTVYSGFMYPYGRFVKTPLNMIRNNGREYRCLEIGPGGDRIPGFETVNVVYGSNVDYVADAGKKLPFASESFDVVYGSHVLEHIPWYRLDAVINEWVRILKKNGDLEIWVPDGYKLAKLLCDIEEGELREEWNDGWRPFNEEDNPYKWANGRLLYGARIDYPSWHLSIITPKFLEERLRKSGLIDIELMTKKELRGVDHGWMNLGVRGKKP